MIYILSYSHPGVEHGHWWQFSDVFRCLLYLLQDEQNMCIYIHIMDCPFQFWDGSTKNKDSTNKSRWVSSSTIEEWGTPTKVWMFTTKWWLKPSNMILARKRLSTDQILSEVVQQKSFPLLCRSRILTLSNRWGRISYLTWAWQWCPKYGIWRVILKEKKMIS